MRGWSAVVLAIFLSGPGLRAECLLLCTAADQPAARSACHDEPADGAAIGTHHDCAAVAPAVITVVKRAGAGSTAGLLAGSSQPYTVARAARHDDARHGPPRSAPHITPSIPLRI